MKLSFTVSVEKSVLVSIVSKLETELLMSISSVYLWYIYDNSREHCLHEPLAIDRLIDMLVLQVAHYTPSSTNGYSNEAVHVQQ